MEEEEEAGDGAPVEDTKQETGGGNGSCKGRVLAEKEEPGDGSGSREGRGGCAEEEVGVGAKEAGAAALGTRGVEWEVDCWAALMGFLFNSRPTGCLFFSFLLEVYNESPPR